MGPHGPRAAVMGKDKGPASGWTQVLGELLKLDVYKRSQGRIVRQVTCLAMWVVVALATWRSYLYLKVMVGESQGWLTYALPSLLLFSGLWIAYRIVNLPAFADFLIAVEAEMNKVSWPSRTELVRSSVVVIILMFGLTVVLFGYDLILVWILKDLLGVTA